MNFNMVKHGKIELKVHWKHYQIIQIQMEDNGRHYFGNSATAHFYSGLGSGGIFRTGIFKKSNQLRGASQHYKPRFEAKAYLKIGQKDKRYKTYCVLNGFKEEKNYNQSIANYIIEINTMDKYKTSDLNMLINVYRTNFFKFIAKYAQIYDKCITSFTVLHVSGRS